MDDRDRSEQYRRPAWIPWAMTSFVLLLVAFGAFAFGTRWEPAGMVGEPVVRHWHGGFPGFFFGMFLLFFVLSGFRRMWWWGGYPYYRSWRYRRFYDDGPYEEERRWEEWHRREHERMDASRNNPRT